MICGDFCNHNKHTQAINLSDKIFSRIKIFIMAAQSHTFSLSIKANLNDTVFFSFSLDNLCANNTTFKSTIPLCDSLHVYSSYWKSLHIYHASSLHTLKNINQRSLYLKRYSRKMADYRLSYLITCTCFFNARWLANVFFFFPLPTLIIITLVTCTTRKRCCLRALLSNGLLVFFLRWNKNDLCISDHYSKKRDRYARSVYCYLVFFAFI